MCSYFSLTIGLLWSWPLFGLWRIHQEEMGRTLGNRPPLTQEEKNKILILGSNPIGAFFAGFCAAALCFGPVIPY